MALQATSNRSLQVAVDSGIVSQKPVKAILDEDAYVEGISKIIERDFFPDLPKLRAQGEYLDALQKNDVDRLRAIHIKYGSKQKSSETPDVYMTPATFETPETTSKAFTVEHGEERVVDQQKDKESQQTSNPEQPDKETIDRGVNLDRFLHKNTSEDNDSFVDIMAISESNRKRRFAWLYEKEGVQDKELSHALTLPSMEEQAALEGNPTKLQTWQYRPDNTLMYVPEGVELSPQQRIEAARKRQREILHKNTRYEANPFNAQKSRESIAAGAHVKALSQHGKIGPDGKEVMPSTPKVNGYGFVATPSPAPGMGDESPLMTWGEIEGTPFRLDASDTPFNPAIGPNFKIPEVPKRDRIGFELAEKASKQHRAKKQKALDEVTARLTSPSSLSRLDRLASLSPAARRLASGGSRKLGIRTHTEDPALRASYTPSPTATPPSSRTPNAGMASKTPSLVPVVVSSLTPNADTRGTQGEKSGGAVTPSRLPAGGDIVKTSQRRAAATSSLTDNLLKLPKRPLAHEFF